MKNKGCRISGCVGNANLLLSAFLFLYSILFYITITGRRKKVLTCLCSGIQLISCQPYFPDKKRAILGTETCQGLSSGSTLPTWTKRIVSKSISALSPKTVLLIFMRDSSVILFLFLLFSGSIPIKCSFHSFIT